MKLRSGNKTNDMEKTGLTTDFHAGSGDASTEIADATKYQGQGSSDIQTSGKLLMEGHRKRQKNMNKPKNPHIPQSSSQARHASNMEKDLKPHDPCVLLGIKISVGVLITMYFIIPTVIRLHPGIMADIAFLQRVRWPPFLNLSNPIEVGLNGTHHFHLSSAEGISLGVWHILPSEIHQETPNLPSSLFEEKLGSGHPVMFYLHGNAGTRGGWHRVQLYKVFSRLGFHTVTFDYRGYADSTGYPSEDGFIVDAMAVYEWIIKHRKGAPLYIWGHSMGTGVATKFTKKLCAEGKAPLGVILESPFNNLIEAAMSYPLAVPFKMMPYFTWVFVEALKYNNISFSSDKNIAHVTVPVLILHAKDDGIVPYDLGVKLYETAIATKKQGSVEMVSFESGLGYGHKHIHKAPELPDIIRGFLKKTMVT